MDAGTPKAYLYARKAWAGKRNAKGIPLCPESVGRKEERQRHTFMPRKRGQERGTPKAYLYAQKAWAGKRKL
ncbi:hypothetical protein [Lacrimispora saccharolytica]|uniref:hypothetical protein n=1 Tax=Lacrimispora saccharolytica TaxID=84030 RepID=UPI0002EA3DB0|nr:hypothetical protein [Lacrimispora saccharolytica]